MFLIQPPRFRVSNSVNPPQSGPERLKDVCLRRAGQRHEGSLWRAGPSPDVRLESWALTRRLMGKYFTRGHPCRQSAWTMGRSSPSKLPQIPVHVQCPGSPGLASSPPSPLPPHLSSLLPCAPPPHHLPPPPPQTSPTPPPLSSPPYRRERYIYVLMFLCGLS